MSCGALVEGGCAAWLTSFQGAESPDAQGQVVDCLKVEVEIEPCAVTTGSMSELVSFTGTETHLREEGEHEHRTIDGQLKTDNRNFASMERKMKLLTS